jgi:hypothetical protein
MEMIYRAHPYSSTQKGHPLVRKQSENYVMANIMRREIGALSWPRYVTLAAFFSSLALTGPKNEMETLESKSVKFLLAAM